jgi:hypothetical protein
MDLRAINLIELPTFAGGGGVRFDQERFPRVATDEPFETRDPLALNKQKFPGWLLICIRVMSTRGKFGSPVPGRNDMAFPIHLKYIFSVVFRIHGTRVEVSRSTGSDQGIGHDAYQM